MQRKVKGQNVTPAKMTSCSNSPIKSRWPLIRMPENIVQYACNCNPLVILSRYNMLTHFGIILNKVKGQTGRSKVILNLNILVFQIRLVIKPASNVLFLCLPHKQNSIHVWEQPTICL